MTSGTRSMRGGGIAEALDLCLARLRRGESVDSCLADHPHVADELGPLLHLAQHIQDARVAPPGRGPALARARARFLSAASLSSALAGHASGNGEGDLDAALADELDARLARVLAGESAEAVFDGLDEEVACDGELRSTLLFAESLVDHRVAPPRPPTGLERGRDRWMAAASEMREQRTAEAAAADGDASLTAALDACISDLRSGARLEDVLRMHPHQAADLRPLLVTAGAVGADVITPPEGDLGVGRDRMLAAASAQRVARPEPGSVIERFLSRVRSGRMLTAPRMATVLAAVVAMLFLATPFGGRVAADALPGEPLYSVKRLNERVLLALTFDGGARDARESLFSQRRAEELWALLEVGREAEVEHWKVRFREFVELSRTNERRPVGWLFVVPLDDDVEDQRETIKLRVEHETEVDFDGQYGSWDEVPPGRRLELHVETRDDEPPFVRAVVLLQDEGAGTMTPESPGTPEVTTGPEQTTEPTGPAPTMRPTRTPMLTATGAPATASPAPSQTAEQTVTPSPSANVQNRKPTNRERAKLMGYVEEIVDDATWVVVEQANDRSADRKAPDVTVNVSAIPAERRGEVRRGAWVQLFGMWTNDAMTRFYALRLDRAESASEGPALPGSRCRGSSSIVGRVSAYVPRTSLALEDGSRYDLTEMPAQQIPDAIETGARVEIEYLVCEDGKRMATAITVLNARPQVRPFRGTIEGLGPERFILATRQGTEYRVAYDVQTALVGASALADGQFVQVRGWVHEDTGVIHAVEIRVSASTSPTPGATDTADPVPTSAATATPELVPPQGDVGGDAGTLPPGVPLDIPPPP